MFPSSYRVCLFDYTASWWGWDRMLLGIRVQSSPCETASPSSQENSRNVHKEELDSQEPVRRKLKIEKKRIAHWGWGLLTRTLCCFCLLPCCCANGVGKPLHEDQVLGYLAASLNQPFGLPNSQFDCRGAAMDSARLYGCFESLGENPFLKDGQGTNASCLQASLFQESAVPTVFDAVCLVGLPTRCQFGFTFEPSTGEGVGIPTVFLVNLTAVSRFGFGISAGCWRFLVTAHKPERAGFLLGILLFLSVWRYRFPLSPHTRALKRNKPRKKPSRKAKKSKCPCDRLVCSECRRVCSGGGYLLRVRGPRVAYRDRRWALANRRLHAWMLGRGFSPREAAAWANIPRRKQTCHEQIWVLKPSQDTCYQAHASVQPQVDAQDASHAPTSVGPSFNSSGLTRGNTGRRQRRTLSSKFVLALAAVLLCRAQLLVSSGHLRPRGLRIRNLTRPGTQPWLEALSGEDWDPYKGQRVGEASNPGPPEVDPEANLASALLSVLQSYKEASQTAGATAKPAAGEGLGPKAPTTSSKNPAPQGASLATRLFSVLQEALKQGWSDKKVADRIGQKIQG